MPISVMPIWTVDRNLPGSAASLIAVAAPLLPARANAASAAGGAETIASSDIEKTPFTATSTRMIATSIQGKGAVMMKPTPYPHFAALYNRQSSDFRCGEVVGVRN